MVDSHTQTWLCSCCVKLVVLLGFVVLYVVKHVYICLKVILL